MLKAPMFLGAAVRGLATKTTDFDQTLVLKNTSLFEFISYKLRTACEKRANFYLKVDA